MLRRLFASVVISAPLLASATATGPVVPEIVEYEIYGGTYGELLASLNKYGPKLPGSAKRHWGLTRVSFSPSWSYRPGDGFCTASEVTTGLGLRITLPSWRKRLNASENAIERWSRLRGDIVAHENRHVEIARDYERRMRAALTQREIWPSCGALNGDLQRIARTIMDEHKAAQRDFDRSIREGSSG